MNVKRYPDFVMSEYELRWKKAASLMDERQVDVLLLCSSENLRYFTGLKSEVSFKWFPFFAILPAGEYLEPVIVVDEFMEGLARATSWVAEVRAPVYHGRFFQPVMDMVVESLHYLGLASATIGVELGFGMQLGITVQRLDWLKEALPRAAFVDASDVIWGCRRVKSRSEIEAIKTAADISAAGLEAGLKALRAGITESELYGHIVSAYYRNGAEDHFLGIMSSAKGAQVRDCIPSHYAFERGDFMKLDGGARYKGYWCDFCRMAAIGSLTEDRIRCIEMSMEANATAMATLAPGRSIKEVAGAVDQYLSTQGYGEFQRFMGHGVGLDIHEPPIIQSDNTELLMPGNVLAIEIGTMNLDCFDDGTFTLEDIVVVTNEGWQLVTDRLAPDLILV